MGCKTSTVSEHFARQLDQLGLVIVMVGGWGGDGCLVKGEG